MRTSRGIATVVSLLVSHCGEYPCECKKIYSRQISQIVANNMANGLTNAIRHQSQCSQNDLQIKCKTFIFAAYSPEMIRLPRRITEKVRPFKWLRMLPNFLRIPANFLRSLRSVCRISGESFAKVKTTYECLTNALPSIIIYCDAYENNKHMLS